MYNLRYHVASLVAVFLALSVGLLLGTLVVERGAITRQRNSLVDSLRKDFRTLTTQNEQLNARTQTAEAFSAEVVPLLVAGSLDGKTIGVIDGAERSDGLAAVQSVVRAAGGRVIVLRFQRPGLGLGDAEVSRVASEAASPSGETGTIGERVARVLAAEWTSVGERPVTDALVGANVLAVEGLGSRDAIDALVIMAGEGESADSEALAVGTAMEGLHKVAIGAQSTKRATGVAASAFAAGLSAVDHVDTSMGAVSIVWILSGRAEGYFGLGEKAESAYPRLAATSEP